MLRVTLTLLWQRDVPVVGLGTASAVSGARGGQELPRTTSQSLGWVMQCPALSSQLPGLGFLQASLLTIHTFKESSAAPFFPIVFLAP